MGTTEVLMTLHDDDAVICQTKGRMHLYVSRYLCSRRRQAKICKTATYSVDASKAFSKVVPLRKLGRLDFTSSSPLSNGTDLAQKRNFTSQCVKTTATVDLTLSTLGER